MVLSYLHILFKHMLDYLCGSAIFSVYLTPRGHCRLLRLHVTYVLYICGMLLS